MIAVENTLPIEKGSAMVHFIYPLDSHGYARAEIFEIVTEDGITEYCIGFGLLGCIYDTVLEGYETYTDALDSLADILDDDYDLQIAVD